MECTCNGINYIPSLAQICKAWNALGGKVISLLEEISAFIFVEKRNCAAKMGSGSIMLIFVNAGFGDENGFEKLWDKEGPAV